MARKLKDQQAAWRQETEELTDVRLGIRGLHVLQDEHRVDERETPIVEEPQIPRRVEVIATRVGKAIVTVGRRDHRTRDIHAVTGKEVLRQGLSDPPGATSKIEGSSAVDGDAVGLRAIERDAQFVFAAPEEFPGRELAVRESSPLRIALAERVPVTGEGPDARTHHVPGV
jgi:hypothetical protein